MLKLKLQTFITCVFRKWKLEP